MAIRPVMKRLLVLLLCITLGLGLTGCASPEQLYQRANLLLSKGEYEKAATKFEELGSYEDASLLTIYARAAVAGEAGMYRDALPTPSA